MKLVLAEKPSVAQSIAKVLGAAKREDGYLEGNGYVVSWCVGHLVELAQPEGTYMLFLDCTDWCAAHNTTIDQLEKAGWDVGVAWQDGRAFHGPCHIRMNLALPLSRVQEAFDRLKKYVFC